MSDSNKEKQVEETKKDVEAKEKPATKEAASKEAPKKEAPKKEAAKKEEKSAKSTKPVKKSKEVAVTKAHLFDTIRSPIVTEKSQLGLEFNKVAFEVAVNASKKQIKEAVESLFSVEVLKVNVLNRKGKVKRFKGKIGKRKDTRKAIVTIKEGQTIDVAAGI